MESVRLLIADEHKLQAKMFEFYLKNQGNYETVGIASNFEELNTHLDKQIAKIVLLNSDLLWLIGIENLAKIKGIYSDIKFILYSHELDASTIKKCLQIGINGYLTMSAELNELSEAVAKVSRGDIFLDMNSLNNLAQEIASGSLRSDSKKHTSQGVLKITKREKQILTLIAKENTTASIAQKLNISQRTVDAHRRNIMLKLGVKNTAGLIKVAFERKLIDLDL